MKYVIKITHFILKILGIEYLIYIAVFRLHDISSSENVYQANDLGMMLGGIAMFLQGRMICLASDY